MNRYNSSRTEIYFDAGVSDLFLRGRVTLFVRFDGEMEHVKNIILACQKKKKKTLSKRSLFELNLCSAMGSCVSC